MYQQYNKADIHWRKSPDNKLLLLKCTIFGALCRTGKDSASSIVLYCIIFTK